MHLIYVSDTHMAVLHDMDVNHVQGEVGLEVGVSRQVELKGPEGAQLAEDTLAHCAWADFIEQTKLSVALVAKFYFCAL